MRQKYRSTKLARRAGQALVEFALGATLIFFLVSAAVDLGLIFFTLQGLNNAGAEGANWGSTNVVVNRTTGVSTLDINGIQDRIRKESGTRGGIGFVNLLDLNNNATPDVTIRNGCPNAPSEPTVGPCAVYETVSGTAVVTSNITVRAVSDPTLGGNVTASSPECVDILRTISAGVPCYVYVRVTYSYKPVFPLIPAFGGSRFDISSSYFVQIRTASGRGDPNATVTSETTCNVPNLIGLTRPQVQSVKANLNPPFTGDWNLVGFTNNTQVVRQQSASGIMPCNATVNLNR